MLRLCNEARVPRHRRRGPQRRVRRERARVRRRAARPHRARRASSTSTRRRCSSTCGPARSATCSRTSCAAEHGVTLRALAAVDGAVDRRRLARVPRRGPALDPLREDRGHRRRPRRRARRRHARSTPAARRAPRSAPTSRRCSSAPRARSASSSARRLRVHPAPPPRSRAAYAFASFADGLDAMRRIVQRGRDARGAAPVRRDRGRPQLPDRRRARAARARRGRRRTRRRDAAHRRTRSARHARASIDVGLVEQWMGHRNDVSALEALISRGLRRRHDGDRRLAGATLPDDLRARAPRAIRGVEHTMVASAHQSHSYPDGACLYFTFAGKPAGRRARGVLPRAVGRRATRAVLAGGGALSHHHGVGLNRARFVARRARRGLRRAAVGEGRARPERHPQPRQARPAPARSAQSAWP